jgi:hypothetical protein
MNWLKKAGTFAAKTAVRCAVKMALKAIALPLVVAVEGV